MKVILLSGSPKTSGSTSGQLLAELRRSLSSTATVEEAGLHTLSVTPEQRALLQGGQVWVLACPLYIDGLPGHLLACLEQLEKGPWQPGTLVYGIVNCGFYEGAQAECALELIQNWCAKAGLAWGGGLGVGGGGGYTEMPAVQHGHGPRGPVERALDDLAERILRREAMGNRYLSVAFPRFLYKLTAQMGWRQQIKANGGKPRDLGNRPGPSASGKTKGEV